jgi:hypothetical protein
MVLFPIALLWLVGVLIWVVRNEGAPGHDAIRVWRRWLPKRPAGGRDAGPHDASGGRRGGRAATQAHARAAKRP